MNLGQATPAENRSDVKTELRCRRCGYRAIILGHMPSCPMCQATAWDELDLAPTVLAVPRRTSSAPATESPTARPTCEIVEEVLADLSSTQSSFACLSGRAYRLERYHREWRVLAVSERGSRWVDVEDIRACWETFERLGRIQREDVLDPGRCSSFMMALFEQVPGIEQTAGDSASLAFA